MKAATLVVLGWKRVRSGGPALVAGRMDVRADMSVQPCTHAPIRPHTHAAMHLSLVS